MTTVLTNEQGSNGLTHQQLVEECNEEITINEDGEESTRILIEDLEDALIEHRKNLQLYQSEIDFWTERFNSLTEDGN